MTGSFYNNLYSNSKQIKPEVGMGATELMWTDRNAYTIIQVLNDKTIVVQRDDVKRIGPKLMSDSQEYSYTPNTNNNTYVVTLRNNGKWVTRG